MSNLKISNVKLGIFVTLALALFTVAMYYMGNRQHMFGSSITISSIFGNVKGLKVGNSVRYAGISAGTVDRLAIINDSTIRVDMSIDKKIARFIKQDAEATIVTNGLVGDMIINISPGKGKVPLINAGNVISSSSNKETGEMLNTLGTTADNVEVLTHNLIEITDGINNGKGTIATLLNNMELADELQTTISNLKKTSENINTLSTQFQQRMDDIDQGEGLLGYLMTDTLFEDRVEKITLALDSLINQRVTPIIDNIETSTTQILSSTSKMEEIVNDIDLDEGLIGALMTDTLVAQDVKEMIQHLNDGTFKFNESMEALKHNFLLRGYFKKQEKKRKKELERQQKELESKSKSKNSDNNTSPQD